jgi:hypothetical protein
MIALDQLVAEFAERVAAIVLERLHLGMPGMIDQASSPLGRRRHCTAVRRRRDRGEPGASIVGRRHLLSPEALSEELRRASGRPRSTAAQSPGAGSVRAELAAELRVLKGGCRG